jgi:hypothetical protein
LPSDFEPVVNLPIPQPQFARRPPPIDHGREGRVFVTRNDQNASGPHVIVSLRPMGVVAGFETAAAMRARGFTMNLSDGKQIVVPADKIADVTTYRVAQG